MSFAAFLPSMTLAATEPVWQSQAQIGQSSHSFKSASTRATQANQAEMYK